MERIGERLEELIKSDVSLDLLAHKTIRNLRVAVGIFEGLGCEVCHIGPDRGDLSYFVKPRATHGGSHLKELHAFNGAGITLIALENGQNYAIYHEPEAWPQGLPYKELSREEYVTSRMAICIP